MAEDDANKGGHPILVERLKWASANVATFSAILAGAVLIRAASEGYDTSTRLIGDSLFEFLMSGYLLLLGALPYLFLLALVPSSWPAFVVRLIAILGSPVIGSVAIAEAITEQFPLADLVAYGIVVPFLCGIAVRPPR